MNNLYLVDLNRNMVVHVDDTLLKEAQKLSAKEDKSNNRDILRANPETREYLINNIRLKLSRFTLPLSRNQIISIFSDAIRAYRLDNIKYYPHLYYTIYIDKDDIGYRQVDLKNRDFNRLELIRSLRVAIDFQQLVA